MSLFFIVIIASIARSAAAVSGSVIAAILTTVARGCRADGMALENGTDPVRAVRMARFSE
jgi:hypothetical protein